MRDSTLLYTSPTLFQESCLVKAPTDPQENLQKGNLNSALNGQFLLPNIRFLYLCYINRE